ncbi:MAG: hypothetical protein AAGG02_17535 [Cyanobacteria bacterium P01_H01_bin.15]
MQLIAHPMVHCFQITLQDRRLPNLLVHGIISIPLGSDASAVRKVWERAGYDRKRYRLRHAAPIR